MMGEGAGEQIKPADWFYGYELIRQGFIKRCWLIWLSANNAWFLAVILPPSYLIYSSDIIPSVYYYASSVAESIPCHPKFHQNLLRHVSCTVYFPNKIPSLSAGLCFPFYLITASHRSSYFWRQPCSSWWIDGWGRVLYLRIISLKSNETLPIYEY